MAEASAADTYYFFLVPPREPRTSYEHCAIAIAEGLRELGKCVVANAPFWPRADGSMLFEHDPQIDPTECRALFFSENWPYEGHAFPDLVRRPTRALKIYLDKEDGSRIASLMPGFPAFDLVLRSHFGRKTRYPAHFKPWAFGLTERIIDATRPVPGERVESRAIVSYRHTRYPHSVRRFVDTALLPKLANVLPIYHFTEPLDGDAPPMSERERALWQITGKRHSPPYYRALRTSSLCAAFGGYFVAPWSHDPASSASVFIKTLLTKANRPTSQIAQWDSWRLWESFAAGCATMHLDLERYGAILPEMPANGAHYIGIDASRIDDTVARLREDPESIARIGDAGRRWAENHYAPRPTAMRLLRLIGADVPASPGPSERLAEPS